MKNSPRLIASYLLALTATAAAVSAFQPMTPLSSRQQRIGSSKVLLHESYSDDDGYEIRGETTANGIRRPQTTFGAENVPVEQRPSNEYLNLIGQPTFNWASQESGDSGLGIRLAVVYFAFLAFM